MTKTSSKKTKVIVGQSSKTRSATNKEKRKLKEINEEKEDEEAYSSFEEELSRKERR